MIKKILFVFVISFLLIPNIVFAADACTDDSQCSAPNLYCNAGICVQCVDNGGCFADTPICVNNFCSEPIDNEGEACTSDIDCGFGVCTDGTCQAVIPDLCVDDSECPSYQSCTAGFCLDKGGSGTPCEKDSDCSSGKCDTSAVPNVCGVAEEQKPIIVPAEATDAQEAVQDAMKKIDSIFSSDIIKGGVGEDGLKPNLNKIVGKAVSVLLGIIGIVALLVFVVSGIMWIISRGEPKKLQMAQNSMIWAALGLFVIFISYVMVSFIINSFNF